MRLQTKYMLAAAALMLLSSPQTFNPCIAADSIHTAPVCEPYEPGSSTVLNEWNFTPGEQTTVASDYSRAQQNHRSGHSKNKNHHHSST